MIDYRTEMAYAVDGAWAARLAFQILRDAEWSDPNWPDTCAECGATKLQGRHRSDCSRAQAMNILRPIAAGARLSIV